MNVNSYVRLTQEKASQRGWLWSKLVREYLPCVKIALFTVVDWLTHLDVEIKKSLKARSWVIEFEFKVGGDASVPGDGFAFWYVKEKEAEGPVFGYKDLFEGLGVFFDTFMNGPRYVSFPPSYRFATKNKYVVQCVLIFLMHMWQHAFPFIMGAVGDGKSAYDLLNDGKANEIGSCTASFRNKDTPTKARIKYIRDEFLEVSINLDESVDWKTCFRVDGLTLPTSGYIGFTSITGEVYGRI
jgi:lectin, mannose-binding 2